MRIVAAIALIIAANIAPAAEPSTACHSLAKPTLEANHLPTYSVRQLLHVLRKSAKWKMPVAVTIVCTETWIAEEELELLVSLLDSTEPCASVTSVYDSTLRFGETSTIGREAALLLDGYRRGVYGEGQRYGSTKEQLKTWWNERKARPMTESRVKAVLTVLARGREDRLGQTILRIFGATSFDEAAATYDLLGKAERTSIDEAVERLIAGAPAAFQLSVDNEARR